MKRNWYCLVQYSCPASHCLEIELKIYTQMRALLRLRKVQSGFSWWLRLQQSRVYYVQCNVPQATWIKGTRTLEWALNHDLTDYMLSSACGQLWCNCMVDLLTAWFPSFIQVKLFYISIGLYVNQVHHTQGHDLEIEKYSKMIFNHTCYNLTDQLWFRLWSLQDNSGNYIVQKMAAIGKMSQEINILCSFLSQQQSTAHTVSAWWIISKDQRLDICTKTSALKKACINGRHQKYGTTLAPEELYIDCNIQICTRCCVEIVALTIVAIAGSLKWARHGIISSLLIIGFLVFI